MIFDVCILTVCALILNNIVVYLITTLVTYFDDGRFTFLADRTVALISHSLTSVYRLSSVRNVLWLKGVS